MPTATSARSSRSRNSSRCEISVPSASFSGSTLIGVLRTSGRGGAGGLTMDVREFDGWGCGLVYWRWCRRRRGRGALRAACLFQLYLFLELLAELARHGTCPPDPAAE